MGQTFSFLPPMPVFLARDVNRVLHFTADEVPPEVQSLGQAEAMVRPSAVWTTLVKCRYVLAFLIVAATGGTYAVIFEQARIKGQLDQMLSVPGLAVFGGLGLLFLGLAVLVCRMSPDMATVLFYGEAAVVTQGNKCALIPWKQLLWRPGIISTSGGQEFRCTWMENHDRFEERIWALTAEHWVPAALERIQAGETVTCGDLSISSTHVGYKDQTIPWTDVTGLMIQVGKIYRLAISNSGFFAWATVDLHQIPNARGIEQLIASVCPRRLLQPVQ